MASCIKHYIKAKRGNINPSDGKAYLSSVKIDIYLADFQSNKRQMVFNKACICVL